MYCSCYSNTMRVTHHVTFNTFPIERIMTVLEYHTEIVPALWNFINQCHDNRRWPHFSKFLSSLPQMLLVGSFYFCIMYHIHVIQFSFSIYCHKPFITNTPFLTSAVQLLECRKYNIFLHMLINALLCFLILGTCWRSLIMGILWTGETSFTQRLSHWFSF
jgi:hypothetical protein